MKAVKYVVFAGLMVGSAIAMARPNTYDMSCADATQAVVDKPGIVMNHGYSAEAGHLYEAYYPNAASCLSGGDGDMGAERAIVPTLDNQECEIGYTCKFGAN